MVDGTSDRYDENDKHQEEGSVNMDFQERNDEAVNTRSDTYKEEIERSHNDEDQENNDNGDENEEDVEDKNQESLKGHVYDLRPKRDRVYLYRFTMVSVKTGLERWGDRAKNALLEELNLFLEQ